MNITIIGGGIAGLTAAIALQQKGFRPVIFEAASRIKEVGAGLVLAANALKALQHLGLADEIIQKGRILSSFTIYDAGGKPISTTDTAALADRYGVDNFTIYRPELIQLLASKIDQASLFLNKRAIGAAQTGNQIEVSFQDGTSHHTEALIVADGIHSPIRKQLVPGSLERYAGYTCWRAVIEKAHLDVAENAEFWSTTGRFGIAPLQDDKVYWFACRNAPAADPAMKEASVEALYHHFKHFPEPVPSLLLQTKQESLIWNDIEDIRPLPRYAFGNIVLAGDAAHATTPNLGQGACMAIEDGVILAEALGAHADAGAAWKAFERQRLDRTHYIINTSKKIGELAQTENRLIAFVRNALLRSLPRRLKDKQLSRLYDISFETI